MKDYIIRFDNNKYDIISADDEKHAFAKFLNKIKKNNIFFNKVNDITSLQNYYFSALERFYNYATTSTTSPYYNPTTTIF